jgi:cation:H+ antiporter
MDYLFLGIGLVILLAGGKYLVDGASGLAARFGLSPGLIGLTVVAFGTSAPELLVSINAAIKGSSDIAIGNVIGSNISNISMVLGISAMIFPIVIHRSVLKLDYIATLGSTLIFYLMAANGIISRWEGFILFILFILINLYFFKKISKNEADINEFENIPSSSLLKSLLLFSIGVLGLYFGSDMLVDSAVNISKEMGISERIIGVTIIAIGTSLPELVTSIIAAINKKTDIAIGNILGSNIRMFLAIIGITSLIQPIECFRFIFNQDFLWMIGSTLILFPILKSKLRYIQNGRIHIISPLYLYIYAVL